MKLTFKKSVAVAFAAALTVAGVAPLVQKEEAQASEKIVVAGSSALLPLLNQAAKDFKKKNPKVQIVVSGSSSIAGPQSVSKGVATIGACDFDATKDNEVSKGFTDLKATAIAKIPFAAIVNKSNPVNNLSSAQLKDIFSGKIDNWKEVGGKDAKIVVVERKIGSGTRVNFVDKALDGSKVKAALTAGSSGEMVKNVESNENAIGYADFAYIKGSIKGVSIDKVEPKVGNVTNGSYKVWGNGFLLTKGEAKGANKKFIDFILSSKFQGSTVKKLKFLPVK